MEKFKFSSQLEECPFMSFFQIDLNNVEKFEPCVVGLFFFVFLDSQIDIRISCLCSFFFLMLFSPLSFYFSYLPAPRSLGHPD